MIGPAGLRPAGLGPEEERRAGLSEAELAALVALTRAPRLGALHVCSLVRACGGAEEARRGVRRGDLEERADAEGRPGVTPDQFERALAQVSGETRAALGPEAVAAGRTLLRSARAKGLRVTGIDDPTYPRLLNESSAPPPLLLQMGAGAEKAERALDAEMAVAIVGTRSCTERGRRTAYGLARDLGRWGFTVVSGMAKGIDAAAHEGALDGGGGSVGVLGSGHDHQYPYENRKLYARMRKEGLLVSEFEPSVPPLPGNFPRRNRIIAGLVRLVVVVEAGSSSGATITAKIAIDDNRDVRVVPGRIEDRASRGCLELLAKSDAGVVRHLQDVFDAMARHSLSAADGPPGRGGDADERGAAPGGDAGADGDRALIGALRDGSRTPDELAVRLDEPVTEVLRALGRLELEGLVERRPGGLFAARRRE